MNQSPRNRPVIPPQYSLPSHRQPAVQPFTRFRVVLLNNADCDMMFVVRTIMELTRLYRTEATHKMWQAHHLGRASVLITHQERAELYAEQFAERGLLVIVEPA